MILQPSCSEAVARINLENLTEKEVAVLLSTIEDMESHGDEYELDDEEEEDTTETKEEVPSWGDTSWAKKSLFGHPIIEISGGFPYYEADYLEKKLRALPFGKKLEIEFDEP